MRLQALSTREGSAGDAHGVWQALSMASKNHLEVINQEIGKLDEQVRLIQSGAVTSGAKLRLSGPERARLNAVQKQRHDLIAVKSRYAIEYVERRLIHSLAAFKNDMWDTLGAIPATENITRQMQAHPDIAEGFNMLAQLQLQYRSDSVLKRHVDEANSRVADHARKIVSVLEKEYGLAMRKQKMPRTPGSQENEDEIETEMAVERLQQNIQRLQHFASVPDAGDPFLHAADSQPQAAMARRAASYLKKKISQISADLENKVREEKETEGKDVSFGKSTDEEASNKEHAEKMPTRRGWVEFAEGDPHNRDEFVGELKKDSEHGLGVMSWVDGVKYRGEFQDGLTHGYGHEMYVDMSSYKGQFHRNFRHGLGVYVSPLGEHFGGCWVLGERHGRGVVTANSKTVLAAFHEGHLVELSDDGGVAKDLSDKIQNVVRQAMETVSLFELLCACLTISVCIEFSLLECILKKKNERWREALAPTPPCSTRNCDRDAPKM